MQEVRRAATSAVHDLPKKQLANSAINYQYIKIFGNSMA